MLGPAELRELDEVLEEHAEGNRPAERRSPYLTPHFAVGMAMTRAVTGLKQHVAPSHQRTTKR
jgi:hypothetical protein